MNERYGNREGPFLDDEANLRRIADVTYRNTCRRLSERLTCRIRIRIPNQDCNLLVATVHFSVLNKAHASLLCLDASGLKLSEHQA